jgi:hypothetical protein
MSGESTQLIPCPRCGSPSTEMVNVDAGMRLILKDGAEALPAQVCKSCYSELTSLVSKGAKLRLEVQAREKNKHMLWKSRVNLVKQARQYMIQKAFSEAAVTYEKYIRVLEIAYDLKPGQLNPNVFGKSNRSKEMTVIATTYWDLFRIYDTNPNYRDYRDRMLKAGSKLAEFLPFSPVFPDVIKKAQAFQSNAKNPDLVREFLRLCKASNSRCFVVTASFNDPEHPTVLAYRAYRDEVLMRSAWGRGLIHIYYRVGPICAEFIHSSELLQSASRVCLSFLQKRLLARLAKKS